MLTLHQEQAVHQVALLPWGGRDYSNKHHRWHIPTNASSLARVLEEKAAAKIKQCMISADSSITEQNRSNQLHIDFTLASASTLSSLRCAFAPMFFLQTCNTTLACHGVVAGHD